MNLFAFRDSVSTDRRTINFSSAVDSSFGRCLFVLSRLNCLLINGLLLKCSSARIPSKWLPTIGRIVVISWMVLNSVRLSAADAVATALVEPQTAINGATAIDFGRDIKPILARRCFSCHGPDKAEGGLRLHNRDAAIAELDSGEHAIVASKPKQSALLRRISSKDEEIRMPPEGNALPAEQVELIRRWIDSGADWEQHWSFKAPTVAEPPPVKNSAWVRSPIDAYVLNKLESAGLRPAPPADKVALIRRAYYDLTGLPPTPTEVEAFIGDESSAAYEKVLDRLLDSPRYGERWARHWLDLVRYADTNSFERDGIKPNAWRYRDYVIRAFNTDKPYDQFVREQLAGDELETVTDETQIATGYYRLGLWDDEPADKLQAKYDELDDIIATTGQVFLGLTVNCARCHDHKIDPIPQTDYYKMLAVFHEVKSYGERNNVAGNSQLDISKSEVREQYANLEIRKRESLQAIAEIEQRGIAKMPGEDQRKTETNQREKTLKDKLEKHLEPDDWKAYGRLKHDHAELLKQEKALPARELALTVHSLSKPPATTTFLRGNPHVKGKPVEPGFPAIFGEVEFKAVPPAHGKTSGRRLALANWIAAPDNMLASRVMANRIWQHHFGRGIVRSTNNFGQLGNNPTHPELLNWLGAEFVRQGWRMKPMHKLIMLSSAYRMSSQSDSQALAKDPANDLFWRFDMRRLSAEELRDSVHSVTALLNDKMYGPGFYSEISKEVLAGQSNPGDGWGKSSPAEQARRSIYIHVKRSLVTPLLSSFDFPETDSSCEARFITTQPNQALGMLNGKFMQDQAAALAARLKRDAGADAKDRITLALQLSLSRKPDAKEIERGIALIKSLQTKHQVDADRALELFCLMVLNLNEFVYLD